MREEVRTSGQVITFYSYKGGTGRSMALANVACLLAQRQAGDVLMVDWDLEAPGLHRYFRDRFQGELGKGNTDQALDERPGLIDLFLELDKATRDTQASGEPQPEESARELVRGLDLQRFILRTDIPSLHLLKAGCFSDEYARRVNSFNWVELYQRSPWLIRALAERLTAKYRYVLIDSRTGLTDISGICTMLMPERLVVVFTPNRQSLTGVLDLIRRATKYRRQSDDLRPLIAFPLPSRIDDARPILRDSWRFGDEKQEISGFEKQFEQVFKEVYDLAECDLQRYFDEVQVYHVPDYAYGEPIAVLVERGSDRRSLSRSFESFTEALADRAVPWVVQDLAETRTAEDEQSRAAEAAFARFTPEEQAAAQRVFTGLVVLARPGEGGEDTRRRALINELGPGAPPVVNALAAARLVTVGREEGTGDATVELASEALVRNWPRLRQWLEEDRELLLGRQQLRSALAEWERNRRHPDFLLRGARLKEAERQLSERRLDLSESEDRFLRQSTLQRRQRRLKAGIAAAVFGLVLAVLAVVTFQNNQEKNRSLRASQLAARALNVLDSQRDLALLLSLESLRLNDTVEARGSLLKALQAGPRERASLRDSKSAVECVAFSPDGKLVAAGNKEGILLWNAETGTLLVGSSLRQEIGSIAFSPDGRTLASGGKDGIALWETDGSSASPLRPLYRREVDSVAFHPDGGMLASGSDDHSVILWDTLKGTEITTLRRHTGEVDSVAFSPDGGMLASGSEDGTIVLWNPRTGLAVERLQGDGSGIDSVAFSPDGKLLAAGTDGRSLFLWDVATRQQIVSLPGHTGDINCVAFSPDGSLLASGGYDGDILLWNVATHRPLRELTHDGPVQSLAFSPDGKTLVSGGDDKRVILWDVAVAPSLGRPLHRAGASSVAFRADGKLLTLIQGATASTVDLWDATTGKALEQERFAALPARVRYIALSPDGKLLAASSDDRILLWDATSRRLLGSLSGHERAVFGVAFSPDGKTLASAGEDHFVRLWDVASRRQLADPLLHELEVLRVAFSPDGKTLASGDRNGNIHLWDAAARKKLTVLNGQQSYQTSVSALSFSPTGSLLASSSSSGPILLWDVKTAQTLGWLPTGPAGGVYSLAFSPDGKTLASAGTGVTLWDVDLDSWKSRACSLAHRNLTPGEWKNELGDEPYRKTCPDLPEAPGPEKGTRRRERRRTRRPSRTPGRSADSREDLPERSATFRHRHALSLFGFHRATEAQHVRAPRAAQCTLKPCRRRDAFDPPLLPRPPHRPLQRRPRRAKP